VKIPRRIGWVREVSFLLPLATLLLVMVSTVTLLSYRAGIEQLEDALPAAAADPTGELALQALIVSRLTWVVIPVNVVLTLIVLLYLRHLVRPMERLLEQARGLADAEQNPASDEIEFLVSTFERAIAVMTASPGAEPEEQEIAALQRALGSSLDSGVLVIDNSSRVLAINPAGAQLLGLDPSPSDRPELAEYCRAYPALLAAIEGVTDETSSVSRREIEVDVPAGGSRTLGLTAHPLQRDDGTPRGVLSLFVDLTQARRQAEEERRASSLAQLGRMSAGLAHELRNSLAALRGYLTLIERHPDEDSITDYLGEIRNESDQLQRVLEDFLSFASPEARLESLSVADLAAHVAADPGLGSAGARVDDRLGGELEIRADRHLLERALRNLLLNAVQANQDSGSPGPVELRLEREDDVLTLVIADRGPGLPPDRDESPFEPFATTRPDGVGLGLPMAQRILELHGGKLQLRRRSEGGTEALASLPIGTIDT